MPRKPKKRTRGTWNKVQKTARRAAMVLFVPVMFLILMPFSLIISGWRITFSDIREFFGNWKHNWNKEEY